MTQWNRYGPTAARAQSRPGHETRPKSVTIDIHSHVMVPDAAELVRPHLDPTAIPAMRHAAADTNALNRQQESERGGRMTGYDDRLRDMDEMGLDVQLVSPSPSQVYFTLPIEIAAPAARKVNDGVAAFVAGEPDRFLGLGTVPLQDAREAAVELERCMTRLGCKGVEILTNVNGKELSNSAFDPFWAKAEALGALVMIHPVGFTEGQRLSRFYFNNVIGNPLDTNIAIHHLIFDGVLERHPDLKILAVHGGGYAAAYAGRMDHAWGARSDARGTLPHPPTSYLRKFYFDTVVFTPQQLEALVRVCGAERILMGTDYPFDMGEYDPVGHVASVESFDAVTRAAIAGGNAKRLLGL
ncbi:MAG: amidohydrolase family protein [Xanthobacteraceae bacterium]